MKLFTSDLHFEHRNIVKFTNRGVETTPEQHTDWLIRVWNSQVKEGDLVYHIGDFSFARNLSDTANIINLLNGQKIFIRGNHDSSWWDQRKIQLWCPSVVKMADYLEVKVGGTSTVLFHFPIASWHKQSHGSWHLHGHSHGMLKEEFSQGKMLDVGLDNSYNLFDIHRFFTEEDVVDYMQARTVQINDIHRENV